MAAEGTGLLTSKQAKLFRALPCIFIIPLGYTSSKTYLRLRLALYEGKIQLDVNLILPIMFKNVLKTLEVEMVRWIEQKNSKERENKNVKSKRI